MIALGLAARHRGPGPLHRTAPFHVRRSRALRRSGLRHAGRGDVRIGRDHSQPRARALRVAGHPSRPRAAAQRADLRRIVPPVLRGTTLGSLLGVLPGGGHVLASFTSYSLEKRVSRRPETFGRGAIEGVAAPESANNAAAQTSFIPLLTLGLPAHPVMALLVGAFIIQGITPGPNVIEDEPELFWGLIASMWVGNLMLVVLNLPLIGVWVRLLRVPYQVLVPAIMVFAAIGCYSLGLNAWDVYLIAGLGVVGYLLIRWGCETGSPPPRLRARPAARGEPAPTLIIGGPRLRDSADLAGAPRVRPGGAPLVRRGREQICRPHRPPRAWPLDAQTADVRCRDGADDSRGRRYAAVLFDLLTGLLDLVAVGRGGP